MINLMDDIRSVCTDAYSKRYEELTEQIKRCERIMCESRDIDEILESSQNRDYFMILRNKLVEAFDNAYINLEDGLGRFLKRVSDNASWEKDPKRCKNAIYINLEKPE